MLELIAAKNKILTFFLLMLFLAPYGSSQAADEVPKTAAEIKNSSNTKKRISLKFDNELVTTSGEAPPVNYMYTRGDANFKKMMKLRENFLPEVKRGKRDFSGSK